MGAVDPPRRLPSDGRVDRSQPLQFTFNGRSLWGLQGDTLASALLANGVDTVARSFKYGRRRGVVGSGAEEPNAILDLGTGPARIPNQRATQVELHHGLVATSGAFGGAKRLAGALAPMLPAGFYYKFFMGPPWLWRCWEALLRRSAGLGTVPDGADPDIYDRLNHHCDVLVVGGGAAGIATALAAARADARVMLVDEQSEFGGSLLGMAETIDRAPAIEWVANAIGELRTCPQVTLLPRTTAFGYHDHNFVTALERRTDHAGPTAPTGPRQRLHRIRAKQVVLATGAVERPLTFANNDLPGVMLASAVATYVNRYAVAPGKRLLLFAGNDHAYRTALDWHRVGRPVAAVADSRPNPAGVLVQQALAAGIEVFKGHAVIEALGGQHVAGAHVAPLSDDGRELAGKPRRVECDLIACSDGFSPAIHLSSQAGATPCWSEAAMAFLPGTPRQPVLTAGAVTGTLSLAASLTEGTAAGGRVAHLAGCGDGRPRFEPPTVEEAAAAPARALFMAPHPQPVSRAPRQFVDLQLDVTAKDIELAAREGYRSVEHVKRYTALGFGTDQGKLGNVNGVAILARALGQGIAETGVTVFRPAYTPVTFGAIAGGDVGERFDAERLTPMHAWHLERGAAWENVGRWKRPWHYAAPGETMHDAVRRECLSARTGVALLDASTLGKISVEGADAATFLDRIYTGKLSNLGLARCRYSLMLREDGTIFDDGVTARLAENRYLMHTTTGNAEAVLAWLELWHQTEWPHLDVHLTSVTDHWATAALMGPKAREVLGRVCEDIDLTRDAFPFMAVRAGHVAGVPARIFRISFSGELSYEINVASHHALAVWQALMAAGEPFGITPYGTETMHVLRAEKGFIIVGQDTDGSMTPDDMGLGWAVRGDKPFGFIGDRSLTLADHRRTDRLQFVGLETSEPAAVIPEGAQIVASPFVHQRKASQPTAMQGHVTSSYFSPTLNRSIALAMLKGGRGRMGETVCCPLADGRAIAARVVNPVFFDVKGERQHG